MTKKYNEVTIANLSSQVSHLWHESLGNRGGISCQIFIKVFTVPVNLTAEICKITEKSHHC